MESGSRVGDYVDEVSLGCNAQCYWEVTNIPTNRQSENILYKFVDRGNDNSNNSNNDNNNNSNNNNNNNNNNNDNRVSLTRKLAVVHFSSTFLFPYLLFFLLNVF